MAETKHTDDEAPRLAASMMPGPPPVMTEKPASAKSAAVSCAAV